MKTALIVIDLQNDYLSAGAYPLWNAEAVRDRVVQTVGLAHARGVPVVLVQHVAQAPAPFFIEGTTGAGIDPAVRAAAPDAPVVVKQFADAFEQTDLQAVLDGLGAERLLVCGMMTQNCVTHTAISKAAEAYDVTVLIDTCTTVDEMLHQIALHALSTRVALAPAEVALAA